MDEGAAMDTSHFMSGLRKRIGLWLNHLDFQLKCKSEVGQYEGIRIANMRGEGPAFLKTMTAALEMIRRNDARRFERVKRYVHWIVNVTLSHDGMSYSRNLHTCRINFENETVQQYGDLAVGLYAAGIVHEATHGLI